VDALEGLTEATSNANVVASRCAHAAQDNAMAALAHMAVRVIRILRPGFSIFRPHR
jgi:hypothetical protein